MSWLDYFRPLPGMDAKAAEFDLQVKKASIPFTQQDEHWNADYGYLSEWRPAQWMETSWNNLVSSVYEVNGAVGQCIGVLARRYNEPSPRVLIDGEPAEQHPLQTLLDRPNPLMSHGELMQIGIVYRGIGGNVYLHKIRNSFGQVIELWPYHAGQMWPVPSRFKWVEEYEYDAGHGQKKRVKASDVIHLRWPMLDLRQPWLALSPLVQILREVMTDTEITRFVYEVLNNDAVPRGIVRTAPGAAMSPSQADKLRDKWGDLHGKGKRGGIVILEQGAEYERVSMNLQELAVDTLRRTPETRIAGAFGVAPIVAGLYTGLEKGTYSNFEHALKQTTSGTFVPMWRSDGQELTQAFETDYPGVTVAYDTSRVAALQESQDDKSKRATEQWKSDGITYNEYRMAIGYSPIEDVVKGSTDGELRYSELKAAMGAGAVLELPQRVAVGAE